MTSFHLITFIAGALILGGSALASSTSASDRMNGGFERAQAGSATVTTGSTMGSADAGGASASGGMAGGSASGAQMATIDQLPDSGRVTLRGIVQDIDEEDEFTLSDSTGSIEVELSSTAALQEGQTVTVVGDVAREWGRRQLENAMVTSSEGATPTMAD